MAYIIDTHILLWFYSENLSDKVRRLIEDTENDIFISTASLWEISIKLGLGKLELDFSLDDLFERVECTGINILDIEKNAILNYQELALHHRDPFDRMIISQAMVNEMPLISADKSFDDYGITRIFE